jgi:hypothetical protein
MNRKLLLLAFVFLVIGILSACASHNGYYTARYAPPPPRVVGFVGSAPGPGYVWTDGYWVYRGNNWAWTNGVWVRPPRPRAVWVPHQWRRDGRGYRLYPGHWR